jgi:hypothetical protein
MTSRNKVRVITVYEDKPSRTRYYAANVLNRIEESVHGQQKAVREVLVPVFAA